MARREPSPNTPDEITKAIANGRRFVGDNGRAYARVSDTDQEKAVRYGKRLGMEVVWEDGDYHKAGWYEGDNVLHLNRYQPYREGRKGFSPQMVVFSHELTHSIEGTEKYYAYRESLFRIADRINGVTCEQLAQNLMTAREALADSTGDASLRLSSLEAARREVAAILIGDIELLNDEQFVNALVRESSGLAGRILNRISFAIKRIGKNHAEKELLRAEELFVKAFRATRTENAAKSKQYSTGYTTNELDAQSSAEYNSNKHEAIVAPYHRTRINNANYDVVRKRAEEAFLSRANEFAYKIGFRIADVVHNIGDYTFEEDNTQVREVSYTFHLDGATEEQTELFTSLLSDIGFQTQESGISFRMLSRDEQSKADCIVLDIPVRDTGKDVETLPERLEAIGKLDFTINTKTNTVRLLVFDFDTTAAELEQITSDVIRGIGDYYDNTRKYNIGRAASRLLGANDRANIFRSWLAGTGGLGGRNETSADLRQDIEKALNANRRFRERKKLYLNERVSNYKPRYSTGETVGELEGKAVQITQDNVSAIQSIGRKSVNAFNSEDIAKAEPFARRYWKEMGVKSPFFRAWFGDWRAYDTKPVEYVEVESIDIDIKKIHSERGSFHNADTEWTIVSSAVGEGETKKYASGNSESVKMLTAVGRILDNAVLLDTESSIRDSHKKHIYTIMMHKLYAPITCGGKQYIARLNVEEYYNGVDTSKRLYHLLGIEIEPTAKRFGNELPSLNIADASSINTVSDLFALVKRYDKNFNPKPVNPLLLNKDGTPKVLYHGTPEAFTVFDFMKNGKNGSQEGKGFYLTDNKELSQYYGEPMELYASIQNPLYGNKVTLTKSEVKRFIRRFDFDKDGFLSNELTTALRRRSLRPDKTAVCLCDLRACIRHRPREGCALWQKAWHGGCVGEWRLSQGGVVRGR